MKSFSCLAAFGFAASLACLPARAGSPGGLRLAVAVTGVAAPYAPQVRAFFTRYEAGRSLRECEDSLLNIESVTFDVEPKRLEGNAGFAGLADRSQRKRIGKFLTQYRDKTGTTGLDGLLVVDKIGDTLILHGVSAAAAYPLQAARIGVATVGQAAKLDLALCKAVVQLPVMRAP
jgi:hypothetical protein